jgi:hypothetical protein
VPISMATPLIGSVTLTLLPATPRR